MKSYLDTIIEHVQVLRMKAPNLRYLGDEVLRTSCSDVSLDEAKSIHKKLVEALSVYRRVTDLGRGLAGPQIGESKNIFVIYFDDEYQTFVNPRITKYSENTNTFKELCISSGLVWSKVERPAEIWMSWTDLEGTSHENIHFDGKLARIFQHECDHLKGELCIDKGIAGTLSLVDSDPMEEQFE